MPRSTAKRPSIAKKSKKVTKASKTSVLSGLRSNVSRRIRLRQNPKLAAMLVIAFVIIGFILIKVFALTGVQPNPPTATSTCGATVSSYTYQVPFADSPWNIPTCNLGYFQGSEAQARDYGQRLFNYGIKYNAGTAYFDNLIPAARGKYATNFGLDIPAQDYSTPIYHGNASTPKQKIKICGDTSTGPCLPSNFDDSTCWNTGDAKCMTPDRLIPFDTSWAPSAGNDHEMEIVDDTTGYIYSLWLYDKTNGMCVAADILYGLIGRDPGSRLCVAQAKTLYDTDGKQASIYTYNQGVIDERGMGIENAAMIVTPEEVQAGEIRHALTMEAFNTMFGPECDPVKLRNNDATELGKMGKTCSFAVAPATKVEWSRSTTIGQAGLCAELNLLASDTQNWTQFMTVDKTVPEGMRFKLTATDTEITTWINSRPDLVANAAKAKTARIIARALRDYGWIVGDTTCGQAGFTFSGVASTDAKAKWAAQGITDSSSQHLMDGLFTANNIIALEAPVSTCVDGTTTKFWCKWTKSVYPNLGTTAPASTLTPVVTLKPNVPPVISITAPSAGATLPGDTSTPFNVTATDSDGTVTKVEFFNGTTKLGEDTSAPYTYSLFQLPAAAGSSLTLKAVATDNQGAQTSATVSVKMGSVVTLVTVTPVPPVTGADNTAPSVPTNVKPTLGFDILKGHYYIQLNWTASTDDRTGTLTYQVTRNSQVISSTTPTQPVITDYNVNPFTPYLYQVFTTDTAGNKSAGSNVSAATINCLWIFCSLQ